MTRLAGTRKRDGALSWTENIGTTQKKDSPNMIKGLTLCQIFGKLTSQTKKDLKFAGNKDQNMTGQTLQQKIRGHFRREEPMSIRATQGHSGELQDIFTFSHKKVEQGHTPFLYHVKQLTSWDSSPDSSCTLFQVRKRLRTSKSIKMTQKETWMNWQNKLWMRISCTNNTSNLERMQKLPTRRVQARCTSAPVIHL